MNMKKKEKNGNENENVNHYEGAYFVMAVLGHHTPVRR